MDVFDSLYEAICVWGLCGLLLAMLATFIARVFFPSTCEYTQADVEREVKSDLTTLDAWQEEQAARGIPITDAPPDEMLGEFDNQLEDFRGW